MTPGTSYREFVKVPPLAKRLRFWLRRPQESALDRLHDLERRHANTAENPDEGLKPHEAWDALIGESLWADVCREAAQRHPQLLLDWTGEPSACWALERIDEGEPPSGAAPLVSESAQALHLAWLAALVAGAYGTANEEEVRRRLARMVDAWTASHTLPRLRTTGEMPGFGRQPGMLQTAGLLTPGPAGSMIMLQALWLAGDLQDPVRRRTIGVVFESPVPGQGLTGSLSLEVVPDGPPGLFPHPRTMSAFCGDQDFQRALSNAWEFQTRNRRRVPCLLWELDIVGHRGRRVTGGSLGAAFAIVLRELLGPPVPGALAASRLAARGRALSGWLRHPYADHAVTGDITEGGELAAVRGLPAKVASAKAKGITVVAPRANKPDVADGEHILWVGDVREARRRLYRWKWVRMLALATSVAAVVAITVGGMYVVQSQEKLLQDNLVLSRVLASQSLGHYDTEPRKSITLALAAWTAAPSAEARGALLSAHGHLINDRLPHHGVAVSWLGFSPDGRVLATVGEDHGVRLWSTVSRTLVATLAGHEGAVHGVAFSPDGSMIATSGVDRTVRLWSRRTRALLATLTGHGKAVGSLAFSRDSRFLVGVDVGGDAVRLWRTATRKQAATLRVKGASAALFQPGTDVLVVMGKRIEAFDTRSLPRTRLIGTLPNKGYSPSQISVRSDGKMLVTTSALDAGGLEAEGWLPTNRPVVRAVGPTGDVIATTDFLPFPGPPITLWSVPNGNPIATISGFGESPDVMAFSPDGRTLAIVDSGSSVTLLDTGLPGAGLVPNPAVNDLAFGRGGQVAVLGGGDGTISWWNPSLRTSDEIQVPAHEGGVRAVAISPDGTRVVSAGNDGTAKVWDLASRRAEATLTWHKRPVVSVAFSRDGSTIVTGDGADNAVLWDARTHQMLRRFGGRDLSNGGLPLNLGSVTFSPDGHTLIAAGAGGAVVLVPLDEQGKRAQLANYGGFVKRIREITVRPDGRAVISADVDGGITQWNLAPVYDGGWSGNGRQVTAGGVDSNAVAYAPDGRTIAIGRSDRTIMLMDAATHREIGTLRGHSGGVLALSHRPDGRRLLSADTDGVVREWNLDPAQAVTDLCSVLTPSTWDDHTLARADGWADFTARFSLPATCRWPARPRR